VLGEEAVELLFGRLRLCRLRGEGLDVTLALQVARGGQQVEMQAFETLLLTQHTATAQPGEHARAFAAVPSPDARSLSNASLGFRRPPTPMYLRWLFLCLLLPSCWTASCAAPARSAAPSAAPLAYATADSEGLAMQTTWVLEELTVLTAAEMRASLRAGLAERDLQLGAFDAPTLGECIEHVVAAAMEDRAHDGSAPTRHALSAAVREYLQARHWVGLHRSAGAAPCLPPAR
jgi:hypothetical protein